MLVTIIVTVDAEPIDGEHQEATEEQTRESVRLAVQDAMEFREANGFVHPFHAILALTAKSVDAAG